MKGSVKVKVFEHRCLLPKACKFVSMCVKLSVIHFYFINHSTCVYWVPALRLTSCSGYGTDPRVNIALDIILSVSWFSLFGVWFWHKSRWRRGARRLPHASPADWNHPSPVKHLIWLHCQEMKHHSASSSPCGDALEVMQLLEAELLCEL